ALDRHCRVHVVESPLVLKPGDGAALVEHGRLHRHPDVGMRGGRRGRQDERHRERQKPPPESPRNRHQTALLASPSSHSRDAPSLAYRQERAPGGNGWRTAPERSKQRKTTQKMEQNQG